MSTQLRGRIISTIAHGRTLPGLAYPLPATESPSQLQSAKTHPYCANNAGPVAISRVRTPEGHTVVAAYRNEDYIPSGGPLPTDPRLIPARLTPLPHDSPHLPAPITAPDPYTPAAATTRGAGEPGRRIHLLQTTYRGMTGKVTDRPGGYGYYSSLHPEAVVRSVRTPQDEQGVYVRFPAKAGDLPRRRGQYPDPDPDHYPDWLIEPSTPQRSRRTAAQQEFSAPRNGTYHLFLFPHVSLPEIPDAIIQAIYSEGHLHPRQRRKIPYDLAGEPTDRYVPIPEALQGDPETLRFAAYAGRFIIFHAEGQPPARNPNRPTRAPIPARPHLFLDNPGRGA